jgi:hypothetical protein
MASTHADSSSSAPPAFWTPDRKNLAIGVLAGLVASAIFAGLVAAVTAFFDVRFTPGSFQALLASALISTIVVIACFSALTLQYRQFNALKKQFKDQSGGLQEQFKDQFKELEGKFIDLQSSIAHVDWSFDAAEHESNVYQRMQRMVQHPRIQTFKILTIFREVKAGDYSDAQRRAVRDYYSALEHQVSRSNAGFVYERVVLMRGPVLGKTPSAQALFKSLIPARPEFIEHYQNITDIGAASKGNRASIKFYGAHGRLVDVAFAISLDNQQKPLTLVMEIGITGPKGQGEATRRVLGLLAVENPHPALVEALQRAYESVYEGTATDLELVPDEVVKSLLGRA